MPKKQTRSKGTSASQYILNLLSRRDYSVKELQRKLQQRGYDSVEIARLLTKLQQQHLIDDKALTERYIRTVLLTRSVGPRWLKTKLQQKGIDRSIIEQALMEQVPPAEQKRLLGQAATNWQTRHQGPKATPDRLGRFLIGRGFAMSDVQEYLSNLS